MQIPTKIWTSTENGNEKIIAFLNQTIYKGNPKPSELENNILDLKMGNVPKKNFTGIPLNYIKEIYLQQGKEYIEVRFGSESYEQFRVKDEQVRSEIFEFLNINIPDSTLSHEKYSKLKAGKKPLIAMAVVAILFLWTFIVATGMEQGSEYEIVGHKNSIAGIVLLLAGLGTQKVIVLFSALFAIAAFSFYAKAKNPPVVKRLIIHRQTLVNR